MPVIDLATIGSFWDSSTDQITNIVRANLAYLDAREEDASASGAHSEAYERFNTLREKARGLASWQVVGRTSRQQYYYDGKNAAPSQTGLFLKTFKNVTAEYHLSFFGKKENGQSIRDQSNVHLTNEKANFHTYFSLSWFGDNWRKRSSSSRSASPAVRTKAAASPSPTTPGPTLTQRS